jgi:UDP-N-acetylmuramate dehydrogenase
MTGADRWGTILEVGIPLRKDEKMSAHTTLAVGGAVSYYVRPRNRKDLLVVLKIFREGGQPFRVFGGGSNLIVADGRADYAAVSFFGSATEPVVEGRTVRAEASIPLPFLLRTAAALGLSGLEFLAGIPGSLGGALRMNAGSQAEAIGSRVENVEILRPSGKFALLKKNDISFGYRSMGIGKGDIILSAALTLVPSTPERVRGDMRRRLEEKRKTQPVKQRSAGCIFKNPPNGPPAGKLIESAGLKGFRCGGAVVSPVHADFIVNEGGATASDVLYLIDEVRDRVFKETGIRLEKEVVVWE